MILNHHSYKKKEKRINMNNFYIFIVRLILGLVFGVLIAKIFRPDWSIFAGALTGLGLVTAAYLMQMVRARKPKK
jgi:O-antigen/teichoic acid export membrane protein